MYLDYNNPDVQTEDVIDAAPYQERIARGILASLPKRLLGTADLSEAIAMDMTDLEREAGLFRKEFAPETEAEWQTFHADVGDDNEERERAAIRCVKSLVSMAALCIRAAAHEAYALDLTEDEAADLAANRNIRLSLYGWTDPVEGRTGKGAFIRTNCPDLIFFDAAADRSKLTSEERYYDARMREFDAMCKKLFAEKKEQQERKENDD